MARLKPSNPGYRKYFGRVVAIAPDGKTVAVGAPEESSKSKTINGDQTQEVGYAVYGAVYVFVVGPDGVWSQQAYLKSGAGAGEFGTSLAFSADGNTLAVGAPSAFGREYPDASQVLGKGYGFGAGRVVIFKRQNSTWSESAAVFVDEGRQSDHFGASVTIAADGKTFAAGAVSRGFGDTTPDALASPLANSGAVYVFVEDSPGVWRKVQRLRAPVTHVNQYFGYVSKLSANADLLFVGAPFDNTNAAGELLGDPVAANTLDSGAVFIYARTADGTFHLAKRLKSPQVSALRSFGNSIATSGDSSVLAIGANVEAVESFIEVSLPAKTLGSFGNGEVFVYTRSSTDWKLSAQIVPSGVGSFETRFGSEVSQDGSVLAVGFANASSKGKAPL